MNIKDEAIIACYKEKRMIIVFKRIFSRNFSVSGQ